MSAAKHYRRVEAVQQAIACGDWSVERIVDELNVSEAFVRQVRQDMDDLTWPTEGYALRKAGGRP